MLIHLCGIRRRVGERLGELRLRLGEFRLRRPKRVLRFAGAERGSRLSQLVLNLFRKWVRATEHAPGGPFQLLERRLGLEDTSTPRLG